MIQLKLSNKDVVLIDPEGIVCMYVVGDHKDERIRTYIQMSDNVEDMITVISSIAKILKQLPNKNDFVKVNKDQFINKKRVTSILVDDDPYDTVTLCIGGGSEGDSVDVDGNSFKKELAELTENMFRLPTSHMASSDQFWLSLKNISSFSINDSKHNSPDVQVTINYTRGEVERFDVSPETGCMLLNKFKENLIANELEKALGQL